METPGSLIRFSGNVCGGLRTHEALTFRAAGTAVVIASPTTEYACVARTGRVRILKTFHGVAQACMWRLSDPWTTLLCRMHCKVHMNSALVQVSCLDVFKDGSLLAMGTTTAIGVPSDIYVWDVTQRKLQQTLSLHKVNVCPAF